MTRILSLVRILALLKSKTSITPIYMIAKELNMSVSYVEQLIQQLRRIKVIKTHKGPGGGCLLLPEELFKYSLRDLTTKKLDNQVWGKSLNQNLKEIIDERLLLEHQS